MVVAGVRKLEAIPSIDTCSEETLKIMRIWAIAMMTIGNQEAWGSVWVWMVDRGWFAVALRSPDPSLVRCAQEPGCCIRGHARHDPHPGSANSTITSPSQEHLTTCQTTGTGEDFMANPTRTERDLLGSRDVPARAYYGVHTLRALENCPISGTPISIYPDLIIALACVKRAAAQANNDLDLLNAERARAIVAACDEIRGGALHDQFVVDVIQGGAGTSTNMNANEVIANRGLELMGRTRGDYGALHPNEHVNMSQSTNDAVPTALKIACWFAIHRLMAAMDDLRNAFAAKARQFKSILKRGRTRLQDAVPMTLGQEFSAYATMLYEDTERLREVTSLLCEINMGATAVGTGITAHPEYAERVRRHLEEITGIPL